MPGLGFSQCPEMRASHVEGCLQLNCKLVDELCFFEAGGAAREVQ